MNEGSLKKPSSDQLSTRSATRSGAFFSCVSTTGGATKQTSFDGLPDQDLIELLLSARN
jgi:hypothetical protein